MRKENEYGPLKEAVIRTLMRRGKLNEQSQVKAEGEEQWLSLKDSALALPPSLEVEAALPTEADVVMVPPVPEASSKMMPPECAVTSLAAIALFSIEIVLLLALLPTLVAAALGSNGEPLGLPSWMVLSHASWTAVVNVVGPWKGLLLVIHFGVVIMWNSAATDVPPLIGAELVSYTAGSAWWWMVPGANLVMPLRVVNETWNLSQSPRSWSRGAMPPHPLLLLWWGAFVGAMLLWISELLMEMNATPTNGVSMAEHLKETKALLSACEAGLALAHLVLFIGVVVIIYRYQSAQFKATGAPLRRRRRSA